MASFDMKQVTHIAAEILLFGGITFYLNTRCNLLQNRILEDREKIISHEKRIEELENQVKQLSGMVQMMTMMPPPRPLAPARPTAKPAAAPPKKVEIKTEPVVAQPQPVVIQAPIETVAEAAPPSDFFRSQLLGTAVRSSSGGSAAGVFSNDDVDSLDAELHDELAELDSDS